MNRSNKRTKIRRNNQEIKDTFLPISNLLMCILCCMPAKYLELDSFLFIRSFVRSFIRWYVSAASAIADTVIVVTVVVFYIFHSIVIESDIHLIGLCMWVSLSTLCVCMCLCVGLCKCLFDIFYQLYHRLRFAGDLCEWEFRAATHTLLLV